MDDYRREILPLVKMRPLKELMRATGLTKSAYSRIRSGSVIPHQRQWRGLRQDLKAGTTE